MMALAACGTQPENKQKVGTCLKSAPSRRDVHAACPLTARADALQIVQFCENYTYLKSMGFRADLITGALLLHPDSLQEASEACLNAS